MTTEASVNKAILAFQDASLGVASWSHALMALGAATGSRGGQLIGFGSEKALQFNWATSLPDECLDEFASDGWADPAVNPRVRAGVRAPEMTTLTEADFAPDMDRLAFYADFSRRWDLPFSCITNLMTGDGMLIGLAALRSHSQGAIEPDQQAAFATIAPHARHAVRTRMILAETAASFVAGALEAVGLTAFVCRADGHVAAMTPTAERLVSDEGPVIIRNGRLAIREIASDARLQAAMRLAGSEPSPGEPPASIVLPLLGRDERCTHLVEVAALPTQARAFGFGSRVLVMVRSACKDDADAIVGTSSLIFGLTPAEATIAADLVRGRTPAQIAAHRGVAMSTVRTQVRSLFSKTDVSSLIELVSVLRGYR